MRTLTMRYCVWSSLASRAAALDHQEYVSLNVYLYSLTYFSFTCSAVANLTHMSQTLGSALFPSHFSLLATTQTLLKSVFFSRIKPKT